MCAKIYKTSNNIHIQFQQEFGFLNSQGPIHLFNLLCFQPHALLLH